MASEHRNDTKDTPQLLWTEIVEEGYVPSLNTTDRTDIPWDLKFSEHIMILIVVIIICLCGLVGNGIVIWLLGFRMKRNHYGVYILNLAIADFTHLLNEILEISLLLTTYSYDSIWFADILSLFTYSVGLCLLMAISVERCVSVRWPIWYKCHHPAHLSTIMCALIWGLLLVFSFILSIFHYLDIEGVFIMWIIYGFISLPTFLVLFVSSLTLFIQIQCYSQQKKPGRIYWTILLNVLAFLLLCVPHGVYLACMLAMESTFHYPGIYFFICFLSPINSTVNPIIYFFIGRNRQRGGRKRLQEVLQRALTDETEETVQRRERTSSHTEYDIS